MREVGRPAGEYNNPGSIQQNQATQNPDGQKVQKWVEVGRDWFSVTPRESGQEKRVFEQLRAEVSHLVRVKNSRQTRAMKPADYRVVFTDADGRTQALNLLSKIDVSTRGAELLFAAKEVQV